MHNVPIEQLKFLAFVCALTRLKRCQEIYERSYRVIFLTGSALKSVEDGKIPTKKVKVGLFNSKMLSFNSDFHFFGRDLPSSTLRTFWGGTS